MNSGLKFQIDLKLKGATNSIIYKQRSFKLAKILEKISNSQLIAKIF